MSIQEIELKELLLKHPFTCVISGATGSGKTWFARDLLENFTSIVNTNSAFPIRVLWCYGAYQDIFRQKFSSRDITIQYQEGLNDPSDYDVCVVDDLMNEMENNTLLSNLFTRDSHHKNISVIFITQNLFHKGKVMRDIMLNAQYIVLTKNRRDLNQISTFGRQIFTNWKGFVEAYKDAVLLKDYGHLLIDFTATTKEENRLRSELFFKKGYSIIYNV